MWPDINGFYDMLYGAGGVDLGALTCWHFDWYSSGRVWNTNPPFYVTDMIPFAPQFFGPPTTITCTVTAGSKVIPLTDTTGLAVGNLVVNLSSIPKDTVINQVSPNVSITLSNAPTGSDTGITVFTAPAMPMVVMLWFIYFAMASVMQSRYMEMWTWAMCCFVGHYCMLWMQTLPVGGGTVPSGPAGISSIVSAGLAQGLITGQAAGDVNYSGQPLEGFEEWGSWQATQYGQMFITLAKATCAGPIWVQ
jgi:hypothetical protein